jgi:flagellar transcriptional activator FlhC
VTRAWRLVKFVDNGMLSMTKCSKCGGHFVTHPHEIARHYVCGLCNPPARAGKGKLAGSLGVGAGSALLSAQPGVHIGAQHAGH